MKRRQFIYSLGASFLTTLGLEATAQRVLAQNANSLNIQWLGHTCFLFSSGGYRILVNPFKTLGCTAGYSFPNISANMVLISSRLLDEGAAEDVLGNPRILFEPGSYEVDGKQFQGIKMPHDRKGGRQFGTNVAWRWNQAGMNILHLGGAAAPINLEQKILIGRPDIALIPVGGGPKAYGPEEAAEAIKTLNPRMVIPTHYLHSGADPTCTLVEVEEFLGLMAGTQINRLGRDTLNISSGNLPDNGSIIQVFSYF